jgi:hypothetical protein
MTRPRLLWLVKPPTGEALSTETTHPAKMNVAKDILPKFTLTNLYLMEQTRNFMY